MEVRLEVVDPYDRTGECGLAQGANVYLLATSYTLR